MGPEPEQLSGRFLMFIIMILKKIEKQNQITTFITAFPFPVLWWKLAVLWRFWNNQEWVLFQFSDENCQFFEGFEMARSSSSLIPRNSKNQIWHLLKNSNTHAPLIHTLNILTVLVENTGSNEQSIQPAIMLLGHDFSHEPNTITKSCVSSRRNPSKHFRKDGATHVHFFTKSPKDLFIISNTT